MSAASVEQTEPGPESTAASKPRTRRKPKAAEIDIDSLDVVADEPRTEEDRLDPESTVVVLSSGVEVDVEPLKLRQFLKLSRIITRGAAGVLESISMPGDMTDTEFAQQMMALIIFAIPEAEDESVEFIQSMVKPVGPFASAKEEAQAKAELTIFLNNPELDDVVTIVQRIIEAEANDLRSLGKRLGNALRIAQKTGQT